MSHKPAQRLLRFERGHSRTVIDLASIRWFLAALSGWLNDRHLSDLRVWTWNARADPSWLEHLRTHLSEMTHYLDANADSLPNYGARYRAGERATA